MHLKRPEHEWSSGRFDLMIQWRYQESIVFILFTEPPDMPGSS